MRIKDSMLDTYTKYRSHSGAELDKVMGTAQMRSDRLFTALLCVGMLAAVAACVYLGNPVFDLLTALGVMAVLWRRAVSVRESDLLTGNPRANLLVVALVQQSKAARAVLDEAQANGQALYGFHLARMVAEYRREPVHLGRALPSPGPASMGVLKWMAFNAARVKVNHERDPKRVRRNAWLSLAGLCAVLLALISSGAAFFAAGATQLGFGFTLVMGVGFIGMLVRAGFHRLAALQDLTGIEGAPTLDEMCAAYPKLQDIRSALSADRPLVQADYVWFHDWYQNARLSGEVPL
ncbi:hypothetical protein D3C71_24480 [compost metagenome]